MSGEFRVQAGDPPLRVRAVMARLGLGPGQLAPYPDPERGRVDPLDDAEVRNHVRRFLDDLDTWLQR